MKLTTIAALIGLSLPAAAFAHGDKAGHEAAMFKKMDANGDGKISADEHAAGAKAMFEAMDTNHDGKVTAEEMTAAHEKKGAKAGKPGMSSAEKIKVIDTDGDGVLTAEEHAAGSRTMFTKMDADGDGMLTAQEMAEGHERLMKPGTSETKSQSAPASPETK